ncbi:MAG: phospholipase [Myxococcales bacterium]
MERMNFAGLTSHVLEESDSDGPVVVLMHGFGALGDDLVPLGDALLELPNRPRIVCPEAPLSVEGGPARAWWMLDMEVFERRARGERIDRSQELPPNLPTVRAQVGELLREVAAYFQVQPSRLVLGGFSQGSMVACDVALHAAEKPGALLLLSSTLIAEPVWRPLAPTLHGVPVFQSHGHLDPLLPFEDAERLSALLRAGGADLSFVEFRGGHEIPRPALLGLAKTIAQLG